MAETTGWQFVVGQQNIGPQATILNARGRKMTFKVDDSATLEFTLDGTDPVWQYITELSSDVWVLRDNQVFYRGRVGPTSDSIDEDTDTVTVNVFDYREWLGRQFLGSSAPLVWTQKTRATIIQDMLNYLNIQPGIKPTITLDSSKLATTLTDVTVLIDTSIKDAISGMNGFGWQVVPTSLTGLSLKAVSPFYWALNTYFVMEYGGAVGKVQRQLDTANFANRVYVTGDMSLTPAERTSSDISTDIRGPLGLVQSYPEITSAAQLGSAASDLLTASDLIHATWNCTLVPGAWISASDAWVGDICKFVVQHGRVNLVDQYRITELSIEISDDGDNHTVSMAMVKPPYIPSSFVTMEEHYHGA